ncbi:hypothetical protein ACT453_47375, partial [Bacillus sp. D-CC]
MILSVPEYTEPAEAFKQKGYELTTIEAEKGKTVHGKQGKSEVVIDKVLWRNIIDTFINDNF